MQAEINVQTTMVAMLAIFIALFFKQQLALVATVNLKVSPVQSRAGAVAMVGSDVQINIVGEWSTNSDEIGI